MIFDLHIGDGQVRDFHRGWLSQSRDLNRKCRSVSVLKHLTQVLRKAACQETEFILLLDVSGPQQIEIQAPLSSQPLAFDLLLGQE